MSTFGSLALVVVAGLVLPHASTSLKPSRLAGRVLRRKPELLALMCKSLLTGVGHGDQPEVVPQVGQRLHRVRKRRPLAPRLVQRRGICRVHLQACLLRDLRLQRVGCI